MLLALCLPFHSSSFFAVGLVRLAQLKVYSAWGRMDIASNDFCNLPGISKFDLCNEVRDGSDLHDLSQRFCAQGIDKFLRNSCLGMSNAYAVGMATIILTIINMIMQGVSTWLLYHYTYKYPKKQYREVALILVTVGTSLLALALGGYYPLVSMNLDSINFAGGGMLIGTSMGHGVSWGYWIMWVAVLVQVVQIILYNFAKTKEEGRLRELKMQEQFEAELQMQGFSESQGDPYGMPGSMGGSAYPPAPYPPMGGSSYPAMGGSSYPQAMQSAPPSWGPPLGPPQSGGGYAYPPMGPPMGPPQGGYGGYAY